MTGSSNQDSQAPNFCPGRGMALLLAVWVMVGACLAIRLERPPAVVPATGPATEFSADRAFPLVEAIARVPHRAGTPAAAAVRNLLAEELRRLGLEPHLQTAMTAKGDRAAWPVNLWARLAGRKNTKAFLLMAHYDSTPYGPGAADDAAGLAAILETVRAVQAGPPLENDLLVVFTDAEECGLWGAKALAESALASETGLLLNLEARGIEGPAYLFETNKGSGWLVPRMAQAISHPRTSSLMVSVYERLPFSTDYHMLRQFLPGMNVAFVGRFPHYHSARDVPANLDRRSLQHHGEYALSLARFFGNLPLTEVPRLPDPVYFCVGSKLFWYPARENVLLTSLITLLTLFLLGRARAAGVIDPQTVRLGMRDSLGLTLVAGSLCGILLGLAYLWVGLPLVYAENLLYGAGFLVLLAVSFAWVPHRVAGDRLPGWYAGVLLWWLLAMNAGLLFLPGGSYLTTWPLAGLVAGTWLAGWWRPGPPSAAAVLTGLVAGSVPALAILAPVVVSLSRGLFGLGMPLVMMLASWVLLLLTPLLWPVGRHLPRSFPGSLAGMALVLWAAAGLHCGPDAASPHPDSLGYLLDPASGTARWISNDAHLDEWNGPHFPASAAWNRCEEFLLPGTYRCASAPLASLAAPLIVLATESTAFDGRHLELQVSSPRQAHRLILEFRSEKRLLLVKVGEWDPMPVFGNPWRLDLQVLPPFPIPVGIVALGTGPVEIRAVDVSYGLIGEAGLGLPPRPAHLMMKPNTVTYMHPFESDTIRVGKTWRF